MKLDIVLIIIVFLFIFGAWIVTGGPSRPAATAGPFITPVASPGEESQGYRGSVAPANSRDPNSYLRGGIASPEQNSSSTYYYTRAASSAPVVQ